MQTTGTVLTVNNDVNLLLPLSANIVFAKNFYIAALAGPIIGVDFFKANGYDENDQAISVSGTQLSTGYYARASIGYTARRFFAGVDAFARNYGHRQQDEKFAKHSYGVQVYAGTRFDPPGFLKRTVAWLQKIMPF